jgi:hypothetical protein
MAASILTKTDAMQTPKISCLFICTMLLWQCASVQPTTNTLTQWMTGDFKSERTESAREDHFDVRVHIRPVWQQKKTSAWLYVEQSIVLNDVEEPPFRQRIYHLVQKTKDTIICKIYLLPDASENWAGAYLNLQLFDLLKPTDLIAQEGCTIYFTRRQQNAFRGGMQEKTCESKLWDSKFVRSNGIVVKETSFQVNDQGVDEKGKSRKWGKLFYNFVKTKSKISLPTK